MTAREKLADWVEAVGFCMWGSFIPLGYISEIFKWVWMLKAAVIIHPIGLVVLFIGVFLHPRKKKIHD